MSGTYTINQNGTASDSVFLSFASLTDSLKSKRVNGAITINVAPNSGPYRERVEFNNISGFTKDRPLVLNGNGNEIIAESGTTGGVTLFIQQVENVTVQDFIFTLHDSVTTSGWRDVIRTNGNFENLVIKDCEIQFTQPTNFQNFSTLRRYVNLSSSSTNQNYSNIANLHIKNVKTKGWAYYGILSIYNTTQRDSSYRGNWIIEDCELVDNQIGIYIYSHLHDSLLIRNNTIGFMDSVSIWSGTFYGIYVYDYYYYQNWYYGYTEIYNNIIRHRNSSATNSTTTCWGILAYTRNNAGTKIFNNIIELSGRNNIFINIWHIYYNNRQNGTSEVAHNTCIQLDDIRNTTVSTEFIRSYHYNNVNQDSFKIQNNLFYNEAQNVNSLIGVNTRFNNNLSRDSLMAITNNLFYSATAPFTSYLNGNFCSVSSPNDVKFCSTFDSSNLLQINPKFASMSNLMYIPTNGKAYKKGIPLGFVKTDIFDTKRSTIAPQIGAIESLDGLIVTEFNTDLDTLICSNQSGEFSFIIENQTGIDLDNVGVNLAVNGEIRLTESFNANLNRGDVDTFTFSEKLMLNGVGKQKIDIYAIGANLDSVNQYQTYTITLKPTPYGANIEPEVLVNKYFFDGDSANPDVVLVTDRLDYKLIKPTELSYSGLGTDWGVRNISFSDSFRRVDTSRGLFANVINESLSFIPTEVLEGQHVTMRFRMENYQNGCDSTIERQVRVLHTPDVNFQYSFNCLGESTQLINNTQFKGDDRLEAFWDLGENDETSEFWSTEHTYENKGIKPVTLKVWFYEYPNYEFSITRSTLITPYPEPNFRMKPTCAKSSSEFIDLSDIDAGSISFARYHWGFGDSSTLSDVTDPEHIYRSGGTYDVTLMIDILGCRNEFTRRVSVLYTPDADFEINDICLGDTLFVNNKSTIGEDRLTVLWDFNGEGTSFAAQPSFIFDDIGQKNIQLIARSPFGCADTLTKEITVGSIPDLELEKESICIDVPTTFLVKNNENDANIQSWEWKLDDEIVSQENSYTGTFDEIKSRILEIIATTDNGCESTLIDTIDVLNRATASFEAPSVCQGEDVLFENTSTITGGEAQYRWFFGTGDTSNEKSPVYNYGNLFGVVSVTLEATIVEGCTDQTVKIVNINKAPSSKFLVQSRNNLQVNVIADEEDVSYFWTMGDGTEFNTRQVSHTYSSDKYLDSNICLTTINSANCKSLEDDLNCQTFSDMLSVYGSHFQKNDVSVYPNPNKGRFNISLNRHYDNTEIIIYDVLGNLLSAHINSSSMNKYEVDLGNVAAGVYFVQVKNGEHNHIQKITVH